MISSETTHQVVCDECGYPAIEAPTTAEARRNAQVGGYGYEPFQVIDGRDLCHDCTPQGKLEARERQVRLCQRSWGFAGIDPYTTAEVAGWYLDAGLFPPVEPPDHLVHG